MPAPAENAMPVAEPRVDVVPMLAVAPVVSAPEVPVAPAAEAPPHRPEPEPIIARAPAPAAPAPRPAPQTELPPVALTLPAESGLVLVETTHKAELVPEAESPAGPRRARRPRAQLPDEPLQIVETRKDQPPAS
jgi:hypothetical protein